jgi:hypothetical protein
MHLKSINSLLRLLVENEIYRLMVWGNPSNDPKRGIDHINGAERGMNEVSPVYYLTQPLLTYSRLYGPKLFKQRGK